MLLPDVHTLFYGFCEFLDVLDLLSVLLIDFLNDFKRSVRFTEDLIYFLS